MVVVRAILVCEKCGLEKKIKLDHLNELPRSWQHHHDEYMSLQRESKCPACGHEVKEYYPNGRVPLDNIPGTYETRVFIGGNYDLIGSLRDLKEAVHKLGQDFKPILPYDDFQIPYGRVYEWDLRLLHNCKYAIFEVTQPGGELFEIARCSEYGVTTLLVYQARGAAEAPPRARTMLLESGSHEHRSYRDRKHLEEVVDEFLRQKSPAQFKRAVELMGFQYDEYSVYNKIFLNGEAEHTCSYKGLKVTIPELRISELTHDFTTTSGNIISGSFQLEGPDYINWRKDSAKSGERAEVGVVRFNPPIDNNSSPVNYTFNLKTNNAYMLTRDQLSKIPAEEIDDPLIAAGLEFASREVSFPVETFKLSVEFPAEYQVEPKPVVYFGMETRSDGLKIPPDSFNIEGNIAILQVRKPRIYYRYAIAWKLPEKLPNT